ncbi:DNA polymerase subunit gamma-2, mitochondrial [Calliphora vicina]|uniref:DNA polymerase subunit gamma-2, mitochondrial n=1 Tax=Calliphora vicina TaxID=7373 RepID=UPI00325AEF9C
MTKPLKYLLQSLNDSNYLAAKCVLGKNERIRLECSLLKNGLKLREQLLKQWGKTSTSWATPCGDTPKNGRKQMEYYNRLSFLQNGDFQNSYQHIYKQQIVNSSASVVLKTICNNIANNFICEEDLFYGSETRFLLISEYFVDSESGLSNFYNLQRERKIWWMRSSADSSRYCVEPFDIYANKNVQDYISQKCKSITIKANFPFGFVNMESITLVPLHDINFLNSLHTEDSTNTSLIRSVINLDLTTYALILDASDYGSLNRINPLMLNRKLAPYQILLASLNRGNKAIDELTLHLEHVLSKSGLRLYSTSIHINSQIELEENLIYIDNIGIPYALVVDDESCKSGLIKLRSRDTTLFETIHISDIPNYLLNIFESSDSL